MDTNFECSRDVAQFRFSNRAAAFNDSDKSMIDFAFKTRRMLNYRPVLGLWSAAWFEFRKTFRPKIMAISVPGMQQPIWIRGQESDLAVFQSVVIEGELRMDFGFSPQVIVDCGANVGVTAAVFANTFPKAQVVAIEPSSDNLRLLRRNLAGYRNVSIVHAAVWSHKTHLKIANPEAEPWAFRCEPAPANDPDSFEAVGLDDVLDGIGPVPDVLVKLDIEGAEETLFATQPDWLGRVRAVLIEIHGETARQLVMAAFDPAEWVITTSGEKQYFLRKGP